MKKKLLVLVMTVTMGLSIMGCQKNVDFYNTCEGCGVDCEDFQCEEDYEEDGIECDDVNEETKVTSEAATFTLFDSADDVKEKLGEPTDSSECNGFYTDTYDGISITYSEGELIEIDCMKGGWATSKGITFGSTTEDVKNAYGEASCEYDCEDEHYMNYFYKDGFSIYFTLYDDQVTYIQIVSGRG